MFNFKDSHQSNGN